MTVALVDSAGGTIAFGHVGDSRAYRVRDGQLEQLTDDHSLVGELVRSGKLSPEEAETHPQRSVITRALGTEPDVDVDTFTVEAEPDDLYPALLRRADGHDLRRTRSSPCSTAATTSRRPRARSSRRRTRAAARTTSPSSSSRSDDAGEVGQTARMPVAAEPEPADDDEDTLSGLEPVPAVDTAVIPAAAVEEHLQREEADAPCPRRGIAAGSSRSSCSSC